MIQDWKSSNCDDLEITRRLIDLFFVSVLLDAGAGDKWRYTEPGTDQIYERSEGIAVASLHMFNSLAFTASRSGTIPMVDGNHTKFIEYYIYTDSIMFRNGLGRNNDACTNHGLSSVRR